MQWPNDLGMDILAQSKQNISYVYKIYKKNLRKILTYSFKLPENRFWVKNISSKILRLVINEFINGWLWLMYVVMEKPNFRIWSSDDSSN